MPGADTPRDRQATGSTRLWMTATTTTPTSAREAGQRYEREQP